jgi:hypothetical protein
MKQAQGGMERVSARTKDAQLEASLQPHIHPRLLRNQAPSVRLFTSHPTPPRRYRVPGRRTVSGIFRLAIGNKMSGNLVYGLVHYARRMLSKHLARMPAMLLKRWANKTRKTSTTKETISIKVTLYPSPPLPNVRSMRTWIWDNKFHLLPLLPYRLLHLSSTNPPVVPPQLPTSYGLGLD